jgi:hypothetical protein
VSQTRNPEAQTYEERDSETILVRTEMGAFNLLELGFADGRIVPSVQGRLQTSLRFYRVKLRLNVA